MARIRTIKPEFWTDGFVVQLPHLARLVYIAMWGAADDHGYIPDEPDRLAMQFMPKEDAGEIDSIIQMFVASGRLEYYVDGMSSYFRVSKWEDHQKVDRPSNSKIHRESSRKLAIPNEVRRAVASNYGCEPGGEKHASCYYCGADGKIVWFKLHSGKPSSWVTFPGFELDHLVAESKDGETSGKNIVLACRACNRKKGTNDWFEMLSSNSRESSRAFEKNRVGTGNREQGKEEEQGTGKGNREGNREQGCKGAIAPAVCGVADDLEVEVVNLWNSTMGQCCKMTPKRKQALKARLKESNWVETWRDAIAKAGASDFCNGLGGKGWKADLEWFLKPDSALKLLEGRFDNRDGYHLTEAQKRLQNSDKAGQDWMKEMETSSLRNLALDFK